MKHLRWILCVLSFGTVHWSGQRRIGMYGDAARCSCCGADAYGLIVLFEEGK